MKKWADKVNGYGVYFRLILPIMVTVIGFFTITMINDIKGDIDKILIGFNNHLEHHRSTEIMLGERLRCLEVRLDERLR